MLTINRREMLKLMGTTAAAVFVGSLGAKLFGQASPLTTITGNDKADPLTPELEKARLGIRRVTDNICILIGAGGNISVFDTPSGVVVIDAGLPDRGKDVVRGITAVAKDKPQYLINTHFHFDHTGGNAEVNAAGFQIVAQKNVKPRLSKDMTSKFLKMTIPASPPAALPTLEFDDTLDLKVGDEILHLTHVAPAHTDTDAFIVFEKAGVIQTGDLFFNGWYPFIDGESGGSLDGMIAAEEKLLSIVDDKMKIIPGHGKLASKTDLQAACDMLKQVRDKVVPQIAGKSMDDFVAAKPLEFLGDKWNKGFLDNDTFAKLLYFLNGLGAK